MLLSSAIYSVGYTGLSCDFALRATTYEEILKLMARIAAHLKLMQCHSGGLFVCFIA